MEWIIITPIATIIIIGIILLIQEGKKINKAVDQIFKNEITRRFIAECDETWNNDEYIFMQSDN